MFQKYELAVVENPTRFSLGFCLFLYGIGAERVFRSLEGKFEFISLVFWAP